MNELQIFNNAEFGSVRTVMQNDEPWFVGKDVASALGYAEPRSAVSKNIDCDDRGVAKIATPSGTQKMTIINESGLYALIFGSRLRSARKFKRWVTSEVLPSIRKTGKYAPNTSLSTDDYLKAASILANTKGASLPYVVKVLGSAGFDFDDNGVTICEPVVEEVICEKENLAELMRNWSVNELIEILKLPKSSIHYYRAGQVEPYPERREYIIQTLKALL